MSVIGGDGGYGTPVSGPDRIHIVETLPEPAVPGDRDTIGGWPVLPPGEPWPVCVCGRRMVFFFQLGVPAGVPFFGGDQLLAFQCPDHDDVPTGPVRILDSDPGSVADPYDGAFWRLLLRPPGVPAAEAEPGPEPHRLALHPAEEQVDDTGRGRFGFKVGGVPSWAQGPEFYRCFCGTDMVFLCQVPENYGFDMWPMQDKDLHGTSDDQAQLFLGNEVYIQACPARCHPDAVWAAVQN